MWLEVTKFLAVGASQEFLDEQVRTCLQSLGGGSALPSWQDDQRYEAFRQPAAPLAQDAGPFSSTQWAADFQHRHMPHASAPAWVGEFQQRQAPNAASSAWADDFHQHQARWPQRPAVHSQRGSGQAPPSLWAEEFKQKTSSPQAATGTAWGDAFAKGPLPGQQWADEYATTPAQVTRPLRTTLVYPA